jgi:hypothetical protein
VKMTDAMALAQREEDLLPFITNENHTPSIVNRLTNANASSKVNTIAKQSKAATPGTARMSVIGAVTSVTAVTAATTAAASGMKAAQKKQPLEPPTSAFKAKPMPDFKAIHEKKNTAAAGARDAGRDTEKFQPLAHRSAAKGIYFCVILHLSKGA